MSSAYLPGCPVSIPAMLRPTVLLLSSLVACEARPPATPSPTPATKATQAATPEAATPPTIPAVTRLPAPARLVAIGDVHGDLEATRAALRLAGAIDDEDRWVGGNLVLVQTGDVLDRGDSEREILTLLERLVDEAKAAGGAVHLLNGNHELMNAAGDLRYVTAGGFLDFADIPGLNLEDPRAQQAPPAMRGRLLAFAPGGPYARKFAQRPLILVVGDTVFAHGGVLPEHARRGIDAINQEAAAWLRGDGEISPGLLQSDDSPLWTRRFCMDPGPEDCAVAAETLQLLGVRRMVLGHTVHTDGISAKCDEKVWCIDVGMASYYGGHPEALEIVGDKVRALRPS